jgi:hypothetical protein
VGLALTGQSAPSVRIDASPAAAEHIAARGGRIYVWSTADGFTRADTEPPTEALDFVSYQAEGFELLQDTRIPDPLLWRVVVEGLLKPSVKAYWNSRIPGGVIGSGYRF